MKQSSLFRSRGQKLISKRLNSQRNDLVDQSSDEEPDVILIPIAKKRKQFKGINFDQQSNVADGVPKPQIKDQIGLICEGAKSKQFMYRDKNMEEYIQQRLLEEKQKQKISTNLDIDPVMLSNLDHKMIETSSESRKVSNDDLQQEILNQLPQNILNADPLANNREMVDKPIQWVAGMMEVPTDPMSKIKTMELMIQEREIEIEGAETLMTRFLNGERKVIQRGPRGNFQGPFNTRIAKGEYSQMMRTLNFDHTQAKEQLQKGNKINAISEKTKREREKQLQNQMNQDL